MNEKLDREGDVGYRGGDDIAVPMDDTTASEIDSDRGEEKGVDSGDKAAGEEEDMESEEENESEEAPQESDGELETRAKQMGMTRADLNELYGGDAMRKYKSLSPIPKPQVPNPKPSKNLEP